MYICSVPCLLSLWSSMNQLWAPAVQWNLAIRHTDGKKGKELHPEMEQECHIPREMVS